LAIGLFSFSFTSGGFFFEDNLAYGNSNPPVIESAVTTANNEITVTFSNSHNIDQSSVAGTDFSISGDGVSGLSISSAAGTGIREATITLDGNVSAGTITLEVVGSIDSSHHGGSLTSGTTNVTNNHGADVTAPTFTADRTALNTIVLTFNEAVTGTVTSGSFTVAGSGTVTNTAPSDSTTVTLTTSGLTSTSSTPAVNYVAATGDIADAASNEVANGGAVSAADSVPPTFTADRTALNTIVLQFSEAVDTSTSPDTDSFTVVGASAVSAVDDGGTTITLTTTGLTSTSSTPAVNYVAASGDVVDASSSGTNEVANGGAVSAADSVPPTFTADRTGDNTIVLAFSENVDVTTTNGAGYAVSGGTVTANTDPAGSSTTMTLTTSGITDASATPTVTYTQAAGTTLDAASNEVSNGGNAVATDSVAPTLSAVSIVSNNSLDTSLAKAGNTLTVSFTSSETIATPTVTIDGNSADAVNNTSGNNWTATRVMQAGDTEGAMGFTIDFADSAANSGTQVTAVTDASSVTYDETAPTLTVTAPSASSSINDVSTGSADVSWSTNQALSSGSITITRTGGTADSSSPRTCTLTGSALNTGAHNNFDLDDTSNGCTADESDLVDGAIYTFAFNGIDAAGNSASTVSITAVTFQSDVTAPTFTVTSVSPTSGNTAKVGDDIVVTLTAGSNETGLTASGTQTINGVTSSFNESGSGVYTITYTVVEGNTDRADSGALPVSITLQDSAGNAGTEITTIASGTAPGVDANSPTVDITSSDGSDGDTVSDTTLSFTATFSESTSNFVIGDITVTGTANSGTPVASNFAGSGTTYTFDVVKGSSDGTVAVTIGSSVATDAATNTNSASNTYDFTIDTTGPTSTASYTATTVNDGTSQTITITFGEAVTDTPTITLTGSSSGAIATNQSMSGSGNTWTYAAGSSWDTNETVTVTVGTATDSVGNTVNSTPSSNTFAVDNTAPTATITYSASGPYKSGDSVTITATFNEAVVDSPVPQISISGPYSVSATNMAKTSATVYTYSHTVGSGDGTATVSMATAQDVDTNVVNSAPSSGATFTVDNTAPTMDSASTVTTTRIDVTFSEDLDASTIAASDFQVTGKTIDSVTESSAGVVTITLSTAIDTDATPSTILRAAEDVSDIAGNTENGRVSLTPSDGISPTFTAERTAVDIITLTFSENADADSANENSAWTVSGGTVTATSDPADSDSMTITFSGITDTSSTPTVTYVAANGTVDDGTPGNEVANGENAVATDGTGPTVTITSSSGSSGDAVNSSTLSYTATFSESVSDFVIGDITISGTANSGTPVASNFAGSGTTYTFDVVKGTSDGTVSVQIAQNKATDSSTNKNTASNTYNLTVDSSLSATPKKSSDSSKSVNHSPSFSSSISKVGSTSTNGDAGFGGILKSGPATDETTRVIDSGETVRLRINLSDEDGLSEINQVGINTNFKKDSKNPSIPYATILWTTFNDLEVYDKDGIFSDVKTQTVTFDDELILFVDITFDGFMDTTDLEISASDGKAARIIETYEDAWTLNPQIVETVYEEPVKEFQDLIKISENIVDYNKSGIAASGHLKPIFISAELGEDCSNKPGMTVIRNSDGKVIQKIHFRANSEGMYDGVMGVTKDWVPGDYSVHVEIGQKNIAPAYLHIYSEYESEVSPISQTPNSYVEEFVDVSSLHETITNTQSRHLIEINGLIDTQKSGHPIDLRISGNGIDTKITSKMTDSGEFNSYFEIDSKWNSGDYDISVDYLGDVIFTGMITVDNQIIDENLVLADTMKPESSLNFEDSSIYQRIDFTESIVMLLANNENDFEISNDPQSSDEIEPATDFVMEGTINIHESRVIPVVEIRNEQGVVQTLNILTNDDGKFSVPVNILNTWVDGTYTATILSGEFEISSTTFVVNNDHDIEPEILEEIPSQVVGEIFISDKDVTPGYFLTVLTVSGNIVNYTHELINIDISKDSQLIESLHVTGTRDGFFSVPFHIGNDLKPGQYSIDVKYLDESVGTSQFTIHEK